MPGPFPFTKPVTLHYRDDFGKPACQSAPTVANIGWPMVSRAHAVTCKDCNAVYSGVTVGATRELVRDLAGTANTRRIGALDVKALNHLDAILREAIALFDGDSESIALEESTRDAGNVYSRVWKD